MTHKRFSERARPMKHSLIFTISVFLFACSGDYPDVGETIRDPELASCVIAEMKSQAIAELSGITKVVCQEGVADLSGIDRMVALEELHIQDNVLKDLSSLGNMPSLKVLSVSGGKNLVSLDGIGGARNLEELHANKARALSDISDISGNRKLRVFAALMADIEDVSALAGLNDLTRVVLNYNSVQSLAPLEGKPDLQWLEAYANPVRTLGNLENNEKMMLLGIDKSLVDLCPGIMAVRRSAPEGARIFGPECE